MATNAYCYVDETGQDTQGRFFVVAVVVTDAERSLYRACCEDAERESQRGREKWSDSRSERKIVFFRMILGQPVFRGRLFFAVYRKTKAYHHATAQTIAAALRLFGGEEQNTIVLIDALPKSLYTPTRQEIKNFGVKVEKVRGIKQDETETLIRLADALCGFIRESLEGKPEFEELQDWALRTGVIKDVSPR